MVQSNVGAPKAIRSSSVVHQVNADFRGGQKQIRNNNKSPKTKYNNLTYMKHTIYYKRRCNVELQTSEEKARCKAC